MEIRNVMKNIFNKHLDYIFVSGIFNDIIKLNIIKTNI